MWVKLVESGAGQTFEVELQKARLHITWEGLSMPFCMESVPSLLHLQAAGNA